MPEHLAVQLARRSTISREHPYHQAPAWRPGWPVTSHGELADGYPWALAFGVDDDGPAADIAVHTPSVNIGIAHNRATGTHGHRRGAANCDGGYGHRIWVWITHDRTATVELLTTDGDVLAATALHHDSTQHVRVFLAVTNDWDITVRAARHLDHTGRDIGREDLADLAERIGD